MTFWERHDIAIVGTLELAAGILLVALPQINLEIGDNWKPFASDLGTGLIAAAALTLIAETLGRKRVKKDIEKMESTIKSSFQEQLKNIEKAIEDQNMAAVKTMQDAHFDAIVEGLMTKSQFKEVKEHIIRRPFVRKDFEVTIQLAWKDEPQRNYLDAVTTISYKIHNTSPTKQPFNIQVFLERENEDHFHNGNTIDVVEVWLPNNVNRSWVRQGLAQPTGAKVDPADPLDTYVDSSQDDALTMTIPMPVEAEAEATVKVTMSSVLRSRDKWPYVCSSSTEKMRMTVSHPLELDVRIFPLHPSKYEFDPQNRVTGSTMKISSINGALLPFQGMYVSWEPKSSPPATAPGKHHQKPHENHPTAPR